jgi:hypothetical protein
MIIKEPYLCCSNGLISESRIIVDIVVVHIIMIAIIAPYYETGPVHFPCL